MKQKLIIYDLETNSTNPDVAIPRLMGYKTTEEEGFRYTSNIEEMVKILNAHDIIVGYNSVDYDNVIMKRYGVDFWGKVNIDLMQIIHGKGFGNDLGRKTIMQNPDGVHLNSILHSKSLEETTKALKGPLKIGSFDYSLFKREFWELTRDEQRIAIEYLEADIEATEYIYRYIEKFFEDFSNGGLEIDGKFRPYLTKSQKQKKYYLTSSVAALSYKIICNLADIKEEYSDRPTESYGGGFVADPYKEVASGNIYCLDYNSLYPHIMMQCNLYGTAETGWKGEGICATEGTYNNTELAPVSKVLQALYAKRVEYKEHKDERQYTIKIVINTIYGLLGNPAFASVHNYTAAADCTALGRQWVKAARAHFMEHGYEVLYTDTDSVYLRDPFNDKQKLLKIKDKHIADIKRSVPFPQDTFDMGVDDEIEFMAFFYDKQKDHLLKKNYLYLTKGKKLKIKGLPIIKSTATPLSKIIFEKHIKPHIIQMHKHKFQKSQIALWIESELTKDRTLASVFYKVKAADQYKNETQLQATISAKYGEGAYNMIKLREPHIEGVGVKKNYIRIEDANDLRITQIDLDKTWSELAHFIEETQNTLSGYFS